MKILIVSQYFPPERGAVRRLFEFARYFVQQGHSVSVLTAMPNYPDGIVPEKYRGRFFYQEEMGGVKVYRTWVLPASNRNPGKRMIGFLTFMVTGLLNSFRIKEKPDIVLASTPPPVTPVMGWLLSKLRRARFVIEVRDLQPESSEDFGNLKRSFFTRTLKKMMHGFYHRADQLVAVTDGIADGLKSIGVPSERITTIKSGFSTEFSTADHNGIRRKFGWEGKYIILRAGTLGWAHSLETVIEAARQFTNHPEVLFVFVGDGEKRAQLEGMVRDYGLKNVLFVGSQPLETIPYFLKTSDVLIESIREVPITRGTFPAKLFEYMASGRPIIYGSHDSEALRELEKAGGALSFRIDDPSRLCKHIEELRQNPGRGEELGRRYQAHALKYHHRERWAKEYLEFLSNPDHTDA
jgi:glycosyltransferase involved in cell wall biosynthesis